jgi:hypothetical protein
MQSCVRCGWDTRSGSRVCAACRAAEADARSSTRVSDPNAEKEALLTAVLQSARSDPVLDDEPAADRASRSVGAAGDTGEHVALREPETTDAERVALREIQPGTDESDGIAVPRDGEADDVDDMPSGREHEQSGVATSLVEALDDTPHAERRLDDPPSPPAHDEHESNGAAAEIGQDTAEDLAALFDGPTPWDRAPAPEAPEPDVEPAPPIPLYHTESEVEPAPPLPTHETEPEPAPPTPAYDTPEGLAALFNTPTPWERDPAPPDLPATTGRREPAPPTPAYDTAEDLAALFNAPSPWDRDPAPPDLPELPAIANLAEAEAAYDERDEDAGQADPRHSTGDLRDSAIDPASSWDTDSRNATYSATEWPWVGKSGDGGFWAPPTDHSGTAAASGYSGERAEPVAESAGEEPLYSTGDQPLTTGEQPTTAQPETVQGTGARLRTAFRELGAWTAVAQVALLAVGMLCIIQVFVLIVVSSYLNDARDRADEVVTGSLSAHAKVDGVMLPALLMFAIVAFAFAAWRSIMTPPRDASEGGRARLLGLPLTLWPVPFAAVLLLLVILPETPSTVDAAQRITQWAMFACAVLGVTCFAAPRGLEAPPATAQNDRTRQRGGVVPPAGSSSPA